MTQETELPALPVPWSYVYEWRTWLGVHHSLSASPYNGQPPTVATPVYTAQQLIAAVLAESERQWQSIETAPKDGTRVLLANVGGCWIGEWGPVAVSGYRFDEPWRTSMLNHKHIQGNARYDPPTHWMPLPPPQEA